MRWMTVRVERTAMIQSTGAMRLKRAPMMTKTRRSGRSMKPTRQEAIATRVEDKEAEELRSVAIAVDHRIEECSEARDAVGGAGHLTIHEVEEAREDNHEASEEKQMALGSGVGRSEENCRPRIYDETHECKDVGIDA